jgi:hypothetical protein
MSAASAFSEVKGTEAMIVLGADMHKGSHSIAAVTGETGELLDDKLVRVGERGFAAALDWARALAGERVWALEDCRHVSGAFERFLLVRGERVVRVATRLMAGERRGGRERGKSDLIDALAVARAALREGLERLPLAELAGVELDIRLLVDNRERLVRMRSALNNDLLWHLHDLWPEQTLSAPSMPAPAKTRKIAPASKTSACLAESPFVLLFEPPSLRARTICGWVGSLNAFGVRGVARGYLDIAPRSGLARS